MEQLVKLKKNFTVIFVQVIIYVLAIGLWLLISLLLMSLNLGSMSILVLAGLIYLAWFLSSRFNIEYEYIVTNDIIDIDKIISKRNRKRIISADSRNFDDIGIYNSEKIHTRDYKAKLNAYDPSLSEIWYFVTDHKKLGRTIVLFTPSDQILAAVKKSLPRELRNKLRLQKPELK